MPKFKYIARDKDGKLIDAVTENASHDEAVSTIQARGYVIISIDAYDKKIKSTAVKKRLRRSFRSEDLMFFCRQAATLLSAGVTLLRGLSIILKEIDSRPLYNAVDKIRMSVEEGHSLHEAMMNYPKIFPFMWVSLIETGEASGQLAPTFEHLAEYLEKSNTVMRKVKGAMIYPIILIAVCVVAILVFTLKIIPMFGEIYKNFNIQLPLLTEMVLKVSNFMRRYILLVAAMVTGLVFLIRALIKIPRGRYIFDAIKLKVPFVGPLVQSLIIERFAHSLSTLIKSGLPILSAIEIVQNACGNKLFEDVLMLVKEDVKAGRPMSEPLESSGLFPPIVTQMVNVGEETGKLSEMLDRVAVYYQERMNSMVERMTVAFEPLILIFMGGTVGILVIAMYLPIFKIATGGVSQ